MVHAGSSFFVTADRALLPGAAPAAGPTIVWLRGEHDIATDGALLGVLSRAIAANDAAIVLDLSEVVLMSASTLGVVVAARNLLRRRSRSLTVRSPSASVRRIIGICGLDDLFGPNTQELFAPDTQELFAPDTQELFAPAQEEDGAAGDVLGSWVAGPSSAPERVPELVGGAAGLTTTAIVER
jgi:anti-anti-sigma factor